MSAAGIGIGTAGAEADWPLFSIIVVAWNVADYIEECLQSCVQAVGNRRHEVIVVHNASDDDTGERIARVTQQHPGLFRVLENSSNVGLGAGRNQGMHAARGDYILFLDGDDYYVAEALPRLVNVIERTAPELLVLNFARRYSDARTISSKQTHLLTEGWRNTVDERRQLLGNMGVAWNKVYARSFLARHQLSFPDGYFEDIVWNVECVLRAQTVYVIPDVLLHYRQRPGSILASTDPRHFDTITRHRALVRLLEQTPELKRDYGIELRNYSCTQMFSTLNTGWQIPRGMQGRYLRELVRTLKQYDDCVGLRRKKDWRERFAALRIYPFYRAWYLANQGWNRLKKMCRTDVSGIE